MIASLQAIVPYLIDVGHVAPLSYMGSYRCYTGREVVLHATVGRSRGDREALWMVLTSFLPTSIPPQAS